MPGGLQISLPWWAVAGGLVVGGGTVIGLILNHLGKLDQFKPSKAQESEYGPSTITLADIDYARGELGPIITPMEWLLGVPMYARAHRDYRMELAAEVAAPSPAGVPDAAELNAQLTDKETGAKVPASNWHIVNFELQNGVKFISVLIPARMYEEWPGGLAQEYWLETDGSKQALDNSKGSRGNSLRKKAKKEGKWPPRKLTADERKYGNAGPPAE